jgi:hypothetical protein
MIRAVLFACVLFGGLITASATTAPLFIMECMNGGGHYGGWGCAFWVIAYAVGALWTFRYITVNKLEDFWG